MSTSKKTFLNPRSCFFLQTARMKDLFIHYEMSAANSPLRRCFFENQQKPPVVQIVNEDEVNLMNMCPISVTHSILY